MESVHFEITIIVCIRTETYLPKHNMKKQFRLLSLISSSSCLHSCTSDELKYSKFNWFIKITGEIYVIKWMNSHEPVILVEGFIIMIIRILLKS
jgi:hypothetical protein